MTPRQALAKIARKAFRREPPFDTIKDYGIPVFEILERKVIGSQNAERLGVVRYLLYHRFIRGYTGNSYSKRCLKNEVRRIISRRQRFPEAYNIRALGNTREGLVAARSVEEKFLSNLWVKKKEGEWQIISPSRVRLWRTIDISQGYPDLVIMFPEVPISIRPDKFFRVNIQSYLAFEEIPIFAKNYLNVLGLIQALVAEFELLCPQQRAPDPKPQDQVPQDPGAQ